MVPSTTFLPNSQLSVGEALRAEAARQGKRPGVLFEEILRRRLDGWTGTTTAAELAQRLPSGSAAEMRAGSVSSPETGVTRYGIRMSCMQRQRTPAPVRVRRSRRRSGVVASEKGVLLDDPLRVAVRVTAQRGARHQQISPVVLWAEVKSGW